MNVLYASVAYPPSVGGGEVHLHHLARRICGLGHEARVVCQWSRYRRDWVKGVTVACDPEERYVQDAIPVTRIGFGPATRLRMLPWTHLYGQRAFRGFAIRRIADLMRPYFERAAAGRTDVVHALRVGCEFLARAALDHSRKHDLPYVITALHHPGWIGGKHRHYDRVFRAADAVIALTSYEKEVLVKQKRVPESRVHVTGVGPVLAAEHDVEEFRRQHGLEQRYVLFLGRKAPHKGWATLLAAAPAVFGQCADVDFVFAGQDDDASRAAFARCGDPRVRNLGLLDLRSKTAALAGCELLCLPSAMESFGGVFTEAWWFGKPVIGGKIPPIERVVDEGVDGLLCRQSPAELAERIAWLLRRPDEAERLGRAGRRKVEQRYGWDRLAEATLGVYESARQVHGERRRRR